MERGSRGQGWLERGHVDVTLFYRVGSSSLEWVEVTLILFFPQRFLLVVFSRLNMVSY